MEISRGYDKASNRTWILHKCPECGSQDLTPMSKTQKGRNSVCNYLCEDCKHETGEVIYAIDGNVE